MVHQRSRCRAALAAAIAFAALAGGGADAQGRAVAAPGADAFEGAWELDPTRMPANYGPPPKKVVYTFAPAGSGNWRTTIDITAPDGGVRHMTVAYRLDGRAGRSEGDTAEGDAAAIAMPAPGVLVMGVAQHGQLGSVRTYTVSTDGREMTEAAASVDDSGAPVVRTFHFRRVR